MSGRKLFRQVLLVLSTLFTHSRIFLHAKLVLLFSICHYIDNNAHRYFHPGMRGGNEWREKRDRVPGKKVRCPGGYLAFVPDPLPPELDWTPRLVNALSDADRLIGRLAGEGGELPNPHLLMRPFVAREAVLSSRIEGTQATLGELLADEAGASVERSPHDLREVANYVVALEHGLRRLEKLPLSLRLIREIHGKLMAGCEGIPQRRENSVAPRTGSDRPGSTPATAIYIPPPPAEMTACLGDLERFLHETVLPPLVQVALVHYQFEAIHPFLDGNGRVGRRSCSSWWSGGFCRDRCCT